ncbi:SCO7613 C-terminal domain-containing membrane protein [Rhizocola hellebori]|nr:hypothetical protein [Rhizocola hellebori]
MTEESAYPCPVCHTLTTLEHSCPGCGRAPDPNAAAVITLDHQILDLRAQVDAAKQAYDGLVAQLAELRRQRESYATLVRMSVAKEKSSSSLPTVQLDTPPAVTTVPVAAPRPEAAPRTVQNLLFVLGGLLLGIAALVFTFVAWNSYGVVGRAVILGAVTLTTLVVPPLVRLRGLKATAETFAALGMFLLLLDGYAAWFVNLGGVKETWDGSFYAGTVCAITAAIGYGYAKLFDLNGPRFIALTVAQPVLPLYFAESTAGADVWSLVFVSVAGLDALVLWRRLKPLFFAVLGWLFHGLALLVALMFAIDEWAFVGSLRSSAVLLAVALVFAAGAWVGGTSAHRLIAGATVPIAVVAGIVRPLAKQLHDWRLLVACSLVVVLVALLAWFGAQRFSSQFATGARWGAGIAFLAPAAVAAFWATAFGAVSVWDATPWWHADPESLQRPYIWELPVSLALLTAAGALASRGRVRKFVVVSGLVALALALPGWPMISVWAAPTADLLVATGLVVWALIVPGRLGLIVKGLAALFLATHALLAAQGTPMQSMIVMTVVVVLALATSSVAPRNMLRPGVTIDGRYELAGVCAGVADLLLPLLAFTTVAAFDGERVTSWRLLLLIVVALPLLGVGRQFRGYHVVACLVVALYPLWPALPDGESQAIYSAGAAVAMALVGTKCAWKWVRWTPLLPALITVLWTGKSWVSVLFDPFQQVTRIWQDNPPVAQVRLTDAVALTVLLVPLALTRSVRLTAFAALVPGLLWLAVLEVQWPVIPAVTLLGGLAMLAVACLRSRAADSDRGGIDPVLAIVGALLVLPGLAGTLAQEWSTIAGLAAVSVTMASIAIGSKAGEIRLAAWLAGAVAKVLLAVAIGQAADFDPELTAYLVLAVALLLLVVAFTPLVREWGKPVEAAAHATALVALALCLQEPRPAAGVLALWGVAIALTALKRNLVPRAAVAAGLEAVAWIVLLRAADVGTLEAYTIPIALLAVAAGTLAARKRRELSSWTAYGPALAAALLPSLAAVLIDPTPLRRLLLGTGALVVVVVGAVWRKQAPVVLGGLTLLAVAAHELVLIWQLVPAWAPLGVGGLLLVGLAITYERRLRDLGRLRDTVSRMS